MKLEMKRTLIGLVCAASSIGLTACGSDSSTSADTTIASSDELTVAPILVSGQWARTSPMATDMGAAYMNISSKDNDELIGAKVDTSIAMMTEVHEMVMGDDGAMKMQEVNSIPLTAGNLLELKPGGYHIMLMGLKEPLTTGSTISVTLTFANAGDVVVEVPVREEAP